MTNIVEAAVNALKSHTYSQDSPIHVGEVMNIWTYLTMLGEADIYLQIGLNTTTDSELRDSLMESKKQCQSQSARLTRFMEKEGIPMPPLSEQKPQSDPQAIPMGIKLTDDEISNGIGVKTAAAIVFCATGMSQAIRNDIGVMWVELQAEKIKYGTELKALMQKRGWLKTPPFYIPPGLPKQ